MAMLDHASAHAVHVPSSRRVAEIAITAFIGVLALSAWGPPAASAVLGVALLAFGLVLAAGLALTRSKASSAWDVAAVATFLGFVATLVTDASVLPL